MTSIASAQPAPRVHSHGIQPAWIVLVCALALTCLGITILFSSTVSLRADPYFFLKRQVVFLVIAVGLGWLISRLDLDYFRRYSWIVAGGALLSLLVVLIPGVGVKVNGAQRWIELGFTRGQPSELAKIAMVFALAHYCAINQRHLQTFVRGFFLPTAGIGLFALFIIVEPDFGTAALTGVVGFAMLYLAGVRLLHIIPTILLGLVGFCTAIAYNPVRMARINSFLDPEGTRSDAGYQLWQAILAFASGGVEGAGLGNGRQQMSFLPEAHTDFIFAIVGEELGLCFTLAAVVAFAGLFLAGIAHVRRAPNLFGYLLTSGALLVLVLQSLINFGVVTGLMPTKGMSMPFISYGGSNLLLMAIVLGILFNTQRSWAKPNLAPERALVEVSE